MKRVRCAICRRCQLVVTAHRADLKICPHCGRTPTGVFPTGVTQAVQYGREVQTWAVSCTNPHHLPVERTTQIFADLVHQPISEATVLKAAEDLSGCLERSRAAVKERLRDGEVVPVDESGLRVPGQRHGRHVACTDRLTQSTGQAKRGHEAMDEAGMLGACTGTAVPDHWQSYFNYADCRQGLCKAHHLRARQCLDPPYQPPWANDMSELLCEIKAALADTLPQATSWPPEWLAAVERRDAERVPEGVDATPLPARPGTAEEGRTRGRRQQTPPRHLRIRLRDFKAQVFAFMDDLRGPFDNNQAARDVRMVKVTQTVSGCFRTLEGAARFGRIRGDISTARQHSKHVFAAIRDAVGRNPFIPSPNLQSRSRSSQR